MFICTYHLCIFLCRSNLPRGKQLHNEGRLNKKGIGQWAFTQHEREAQSFCLQWVLNQRHVQVLHLGLETTHCLCIHTYLCEQIFETHFVAFNLCNTLKTDPIVTLCLEVVVFHRCGFVWVVSAWVIVLTVLRGLHVFKWICITCVWCAYIYV